LGLNALSSLRMVPSHRFEISRLYFPPPGAIQNPREENGDRIKWPVHSCATLFLDFYRRPLVHLYHFVHILFYSTIMQLKESFYLYQRLP
jgi:hypothetical protein